MYVPKGPNMRGGNFVENEDIKKCPKLYYFIENGPSGRFPRSNKNSFQIHPGPIPDHPTKLPISRTPKVIQDQ